MEKITQKTKVNKDSTCWAAEKVNEKWFGFLDIVDFFPLPFFPSYLSALVGVQINSSLLFPWCFAAHMPCSCV